MALPKKLRLTLSGDGVMNRFSQAKVFGLVAILLIGSSSIRAFAGGFSFDVGPVRVNPTSPIPVQPKNIPNPIDDAARAAQKKAEEAARAAVDAATKASDALAEAAKANAEAEAALLKSGVSIAKGQSVDEAARKALISKGQALEKSALAASTVSEQASNVRVSIGATVAGDTGKTVATLATGLDRLQVEFGTTAAIQAALIAQGKDPKMLVAAPLAAAIRAAQSQFEPQSQLIPPDVRKRFAGKFPQKVLDQAKWTIGGLSLSVPDIANGTRRIVSNSDNATTVGNVIVFSINPANRYHWWAHELRHVQQYLDWGIDTFAYKYVTTCHAVESEAEKAAQVVEPVEESPNLGC